MQKELMDLIKSSENDLQYIFIRKKKM